MREAFLRIAAEYRDASGQPLTRASEGRHPRQQRGQPAASQGRPRDGARAAFERALAIDEATYGPEHPKVATAVSNLGGVLQDKGDLDGAQAAYERALAILESFLGADHPSTQTVRRNLKMLQG